MKKYEKNGYEWVLELKENEFKDLFTGSDEDKQNALDKIDSMQFIADCHIDTDMGILFSTDYIENTKERVKLYRELDNISDESGLQTFEQQLVDRFGEIPSESLDLMNIVRLRWKAIDLGIEKITLKNKMMINYFVSNSNSLYYQSSTFTQVLNFVQQNPRICSLKEHQGKLMLSFKDIPSVQDAINILLAIKS